MDQLRLTHNSSPETAVLLVLTAVLSSATWILLETVQEKAIFLGISLSISVVAPAWEFAVLQPHKRLLNGPWDITYVTQGESS